MTLSISHQLQISDVCDVDSSGLSQPYGSRHFVCQPVATDNEYNADTEPPTAEDEYINSVADPE